MNSLDPIMITDVVTSPDVSQLTTHSLDGTGIFDVLMKATKQHILEEYEEDRITGEQYTQVYLGALEAVLQQSVAFLLNHAQEQQIKANIALTRQKTVTELANTADSLPEGLGYNTVTAVQGLVSSQLALNQKQELLIDKQIETTSAEKDLYGQRIISELAQTDNGITLARAAGYGFNDADTISGALEGANEKGLLEARLVGQKIATELSQTSDTKPTSLGEVATTVFTGVVQKNKNMLEAQTGKIGEEKVLIAQKAITELAQTSDTIPTGTNALNTGTTVTGMYAKQKDLYGAQKDGYLRDAEQKAAKMMIDAWSVDATVNDGTLDPLTNLTYTDIGQVIGKLKQGIGLSA